jgi:hypothetical protein
MYVDRLEYGIRNRLSADEFIQLCQEDRLPVSQAKTHIELYQELVRLEKDKKNGVWARIIKNSFAPLFIGKVDVVCGNPPWIRWGYLPEEYRNKTKPLWEQYGLFSLSGAEAQLGSGEKDISQLFTYACIDSYLSPRGRLGFVITQTVFKAKGQAQGFRRFRIGEAESFKVDSVDDMVALKPFEAGNLTVTFTAVKGKRTTYPVPYRVWSTPRGESIDPSQEYSTVKAHCHVEEQSARPLPGDDTNPWMTAKPEEMQAITESLGTPKYTAERGAGTDPYTIFQVRPLKKLSNQKVLIENHFDAPRAKVHVPPTEAAVEYALLYPLIRGGDIDRWNPITRVWVLMTQNPETRLGYERATMLSKYKGAFDYISRFERELRARRSNFVRKLMERSAFWAMYGISENTISAHKVVWRRMGARLVTAVAQADSVFGLKAKWQVPSDTVTYVACGDDDEAHYLCAIMNSTPIRRTVMSYSPSGRGFGAPAILQHLAIPKFDPQKSMHRDLANISRTAHTAARRGEETAGNQEAVDELTTKLLGITRVALDSMRHSLATLEKNVATEDDGQGDDQ